MLESKPAHPGAMSDLTAVLIACCLAMLAVGDNGTAIMAALPAMTDNLHLSAAQVEWVVNAYLLAAAVFIILGGEAADRFGARNSSTFGIGLFALASLLIALGPTGIVVIAARALQGLGVPSPWPAHWRRCRRPPPNLSGRSRSARGPAS